MFVSLLVALIILGVIAYFVTTIVPLEGNVLKVIQFVILLIAILLVTDAFGFTHFGMLSSFPIR